MIVEIPNPNGLELYEVGFRDGYTRMFGLHWPKDFEDSEYYMEGLYRGMVSRDYDDKYDCEGFHLELYNIAIPHDWPTG